MEESEQQVPPLSSQNSLLQVQKLKPETTEIEDYPTTSSGGEIRKKTDLSLLLRRINDDPIASDLLISVFLSALKSYKRDSVLRPFPPMCSSRTTVEQFSNKNFEKLASLAESIPSIDNILHDSNFSVTSSLNPDVIQLLCWVLDTKSFNIKSVDKQSFSRIRKLTGQTVDTACPTHVFEIESSRELNLKFENERRGRDLIYAYHGSRIENFHSILHNGLCNHLNKNSLFGEGTYLSSELNVCMPYSQTGQGWSKSRIGDRLSCIAVCELITDPKVRCHTRQNDKTKSGKLAGGSKEVPEKYYIVQNDELLRVRYLLMYAEKTARNQTGALSNGSGRRLNSWLSQHRSVIIMISYLLLLLAVGLGNSNYGKLKNIKKYFTW